jgi:uncharacterized protein (TIGR04551 family)
MRLGLGVAAVAVLSMGVTRPARAIDLAGMPDAGGAAEVAAVGDAGAPAPPLSEHDAALRASILKEVQQANDAQLKKMQDEMREQIRAEVTTASVTSQEFEPIPIEKPRLQFFELNGYFRVRPNWYNNLTLGWTRPDPSGYYLFPRDYSNPNTRSVVSADMRLQLDPTINVSEGIRIKAQINVLNNVVLGSTPGGPYGNFGVSAGQLFSQTQNAPTSAGAIFANSLEATRAWAEVMTPVGQLRFGRMGNQWGLGMYHNDGNCITCDFGDTVDRIAFATKIADHYVIPMIDFATSGPLYNAYPGDPLGQPIGFDHGIASYEYLLVIAKKDTDEEMKRKQEEGKASLNYGFYGSWRLVDHEAVGYGDNNNALSSFYGAWNKSAKASTGPNTPNSNDIVVPGAPNYVDIRNASLFSPDLWFRYQTKVLRVEAEATWVTGNFRTLWDPYAIQDVSHLIYVNQFGGALETEYKMLPNNALKLAFYAGIASGDNSPGFGNKPDRPPAPASTGPTDTPAPTQAPKPGSIDGRQYNCTTNAEPCQDNTINNFRFNRDYKIDLILWQELLGSVTDAFYLKPSVDYAITEGFDWGLGVIYSQALHSLSTPGLSAPLGIEIDTGFHYASDDGFIATLDYGIFFPFHGMGEIATPPYPYETPYIAQTLRILFGVKF